MKKVLSTLISIGILVGPGLVLAALPFTTSSPPTAPEVNVIDVLHSITNWLFGILLIVAAIAIIIAAYFFITAAGDPDKTKTARNFVLYALIGVLVGFVAKGLVVLVGRIVGQSVKWW